MYFQIDQINLKTKTKKKGENFIGELHENPLMWEIIYCRNLFLPRWNKYKMVNNWYKESVVYSFIQIPDIYCFSFENFQVNLYVVLFLYC